VGSVDPTKVAALAQGPGVVVLCGRFEGVDERVIAGRNLEEVSVGDLCAVGRRGRGAVLTMPACACCGRDGEVGVLAEESFADGLLEYPQYTRAALGGAGDPGGAGVGRPRKVATGGAPRPSG